MNINDKVQNKIKELKKVLYTVDEYLKQAPKGCLKYQKREGKTYYFHQYKDEMSKKYVRCYIERDNEVLAMELAQKGYCAKIKPLLEKEIRALEQFDSRYKDGEIEEFYDNLPETRKNFVRPVWMSKKDLHKIWENEQVEPYKKYEEGLKFETERGEMVRSKSEVIIANLLYSKRNYLSYKYERPLEVNCEGRNVTIHPDFTILNIETGKVVYWEHAGCMDNDDYVNDFIQKINTYISNQILPGRDLIITYETLDCPLNINTIKVLINSLIEGM